MKVLKAGIKLFDHQREVLSIMKTKDSLGLYLEQGLGKTLIGLCDIVYKVYKYNIQNILIVAPISVKQAWARDLDLLTDEARELIEDRLLITNYEQLIATKLSDKKDINGKRVRVLSDNAQKISEVQWDYIIIDEGHKIKDPSTNTFQQVVKQAYKARFRYLLTGTPVVNGQLVNYWSYDVFYDPVVIRGRFASKTWGNITKFKNDFARLDQWWNPVQYLKVDEIMTHVKKNSIRLFKEDCLDLPDKLDPEIYDIEMSPKQKKYYKEMSKDSTILELELIAENGVSKLNYLRQIASGFIYDNDKTPVDLGDNKVKELIEFLKDYDKPVVIFYQFKHSYTKLRKALDKAKLDVITLNGSTEDKTVWKKFQQGEGQVFLAQYQTASRGIDLFRSNLIIYYEPTLSSEVHEQSSDRIHRIGAHSPASYIQYVTEGSVEKEIIEALGNYSDFNKVMFDRYIESYTRGEKI